MSNDAMSFPGTLSIWTVVLETVFLQQVLGLLSDKRINEKPRENREMRSNKRGRIFYAVILFS